jgi:hypothetical protein
MDERVKKVEYRNKIKAMRESICENLKKELEEYAKAENNGVTVDCGYLNGYYVIKVSGRYPQAYNLLFDCSPDEISPLTLFMFGSDNIAKRALNDGEEIVYENIEVKKGIFEKVPYRHFINYREESMEKKDIETITKYIKRIIEINGFVRKEK